MKKLILLMMFLANGFSAQAVNTTSVIDTSSTKPVKELLSSKKQFFFTPGVPLAVESSSEGLFNLLTVGADEGEKPTRFQENIPLPEIEGKKFFNAEVINKDYILFEFGKPSADERCFDFNDSIRATRSYEDLENHVLNVEKNTFYKFENPDFSTLIIKSDGGELNPCKILVEESNYQKEGESQGKSRYSYYDLTTGKHNSIALDFQSHPTQIFCDADDGSYAFHYAYVNKGNETLFKKVSVSEETGSIQILDTLATIKTTEMRLASDPHYVILYEKNSKGFRFPRYLNLQDENPEIDDILSKEERATLKTDVYNADIIDGCAIWNTHFEKRETHTKCLTPSQQSSFEIELEKFARKKHLFQENINTIAKNEVVQEISRLKERASEKQKKMLNQSSNFLEFAVDKISYASKLEYESFTIDIPGTKFTMPVYYTLGDKNVLSEDVKDQGWFIIHVHGGPHSRMFNEVHFLGTLAHSRGYNYYETNIRGSSGFGTGYSDAIDGNWHSIVEQDLKTVIDEIKAKEQGKKPIIVGASFGGYAASVAYEKGYCSIAIAANGLYDLEKHFVDFIERKPSSIQDLQTQLGCTPEEREKNSVLNKLEPQKGSHMLIIAGSKDETCEPWQSNALYERMRELGNNVEFIEFKEEGHSFVKPRNKELAFRFSDQFLGQLTGHPYEEVSVKDIQNNENVIYKSSNKPEQLGNKE